MAHRVTGEWYRGCFGRSRAQSRGEFAFSGSVAREWTNQTPPYVSVGTIAKFRRLFTHGS